jgi:transposase, IS30 family
MGKHLTTKDRVIIQYQIEHDRDTSLNSLAQDLKRSESSIYRELKRNGIHQGSKQKRFNKTNALPCLKLNQFPFVCNVCTHKSRCSKEIIIYDAYEADRRAYRALKDSRCHPRISSKELSDLDHLVSERVIDHQSLYHILQSDSRIQVSESTLRRYIDHQYLMCRNIDLPRTVRFPNTKTSTRVPRKRINIEFLMNRTFQDFKDYNHSSKRVVLQIDTVIGKKTDKKCLLTLFEPISKFQWGYILYKGSTAVNNVLFDLIQTLYTSNRLFFDCLLSDNGSEFQSLPLLETTEEGEILTRVFYCDPYSSFQKGGCERNHSLIRYVIRKGESFDFVSQDEINELFSHINSQKRKSLSGKTPFQVFYERFHFSPNDFIQVFEVHPSKIKLKK